MYRYSRPEKYVKYTVNLILDFYKVLEYFRQMGPDRLEASHTKIRRDPPAEFDLSIWPVGSKKCLKVPQKSLIFDCRSHALACMPDPCMRARPAAKAALRGGSL